MVNVTGACRNAKIINCSSSGIVRIIDCEVSDSTLCDVGIHCYCLAKPPSFRTMSSISKMEAWI